LQRPKPCSPILPEFGVEALRELIHPPFRIVNTRLELERKSGRWASGRNNFKEIPEAVKKRQIETTTDSA